MRLGAKYVRKEKTHPRDVHMVLTCVFVSENSITPIAVLRYPNTVDQPVSKCDWKFFEEFIEPRREFFNVHKDNNDTTYYRGAFSSRELADRVSYGGRYGVLELIHHSDTKVESVFHMVTKK